jgi:hypothetical protein
VILTENIVFSLICGGLRELSRASGEECTAMKIRSIAVAFAAGLACVLAAATPSFGATNPARGVVRVMINGSARDFTVASALARQINSGDWRNLTIAQLASAGIHPGMTSGLGRITAAVKPARQRGGPIIRPATGQDCSYEITDIMCMYVFGTGDYVSSWDTSVSNTFSLEKCSYAAYWENGLIAGTGPELCGNGDFWAYGVFNKNLPRGAELCNSWVGWNGRPCMQLHP